MCIELVMPSNHLILCQPLLLPPSIFPSVRVFSNESALHIRWPKYWSVSFSLSPYRNSGLVSFKLNWLDLLVVQGTLRSLLQHRSSEARLLHRGGFSSTEPRRQASSLSSCGAQAGCPTTGGFSPDQGSNPWPLHWQADSLPLSHQGSPVSNIFK